MVEKIYHTCIILLLRIQAPLHEQYPVILVKFVFASFRQLCFGFISRNIPSGLDAMARAGDVPGASRGVRGVLLGVPGVPSEKLFRIFISSVSKDGLWQDLLNTKFCSWTDLQVSTKNFSKLLQLRREVIYNELMLICYNQNKEILCYSKLCVLLGVPVERCGVSGTTSCCDERVLRDGVGTSDDACDAGRFVGVDIFYFHTYHRTKYYVVFKNITNKLGVRTIGYFPFGAKYWHWHLIATDSLTGCHNCQDCQFS